MKDVVKEQKLELKSNMLLQCEIREKEFPKVVEYCGLEHNEWLKWISLNVL